MIRAVVALCLCVLPLTARADEPPAPSILVIHSNQRPTPAAVLIEDTLRSAVGDGFKRPVEIFSEYLDTEWSSVQEYGGVQAEFLRQKYGKRNVRVIVASAPAALQFAATFRDHVFAGIPVVHIAIPGDMLEPMALPPDIVGRTIDLDPTATLRLALRLHPGAKRFVFVVGAADRDRVWEKRLRSAMDGFDRGLEADYVSGLPTAEVLRKVGTLPSDAIVYTPGYFVDGAGRVVTPRQSVEAIAKASTVPVYGALDTFVGAGIVGGYTTPYDEQAKEAAALVIRFLKGASPADIIPASIAQVPVVDARQIRRWDIDERSLPANTILRFREPTVWEKHALEISIAIAVVVLQSMLIVSLLIQRTRRHRAEEASSMLAGRLLTAYEDERRRLARDLHDDVTQRLARLAIDAGKLERTTLGGDATARGIREELVRLSEDVHALSYQLHPSVLDDLGLAEGLRTECGRLSRETAIPVEVDVDGVPPKLPREPSLCLFRVAQEALRNVVRHAEARAVKVSLGARDRGLQLIVRDDGRGFDTSNEDRPPSLGQMSMRERVRLLGGVLRVDSTPGRGTTVTAWVPLEQGMS